VDSLTPYAWNLIPLIALGCNVVVHVIRFRLSRGTHFLGSIVVGFLAGFVVLGLLEIARYSLSGGKSFIADEALFIHAPAYMGLAYCFYAGFAQLGQTSIRIRLYAEIAARPEGLSVAEISQIYNEQSLMEARIERLLESGDIVETRGRYFLGQGRLSPIAEIVFAAKRLLLGKE